VLFYISLDFMARYTLGISIMYSMFAAKLLGGLGNSANELNAINAVWLPLMLAGAVPNLLYCAWSMKRNHSGDKYRVGRSHWALAAMMAVLWFGSALLYGLAASQLGTWGPILGWPLFMSLIVITATMLGMFTGEWKDCGVLPIRIQWTGVTMLVLAIFILAGSIRYLR
jgi:L-rhamnose-H+ transport protein